MRGRVLINVHGGGFVGCFVECGGLESIPLAALARVRVIQHRLPDGPRRQVPRRLRGCRSGLSRCPENHVPAEHIGLYGCSAGGLLTGQSLAWFQRHDLPRPAAAGIFCAGGDSAMGGDSRIIGMLLGDGEAPSRPRPPRLRRAWASCAVASADDPAAFPARDPATLSKFPPTLVIVGTRDFALSSAVNLHSKLVAQNVPAQLNVWEGGRHAFFYDERVPEAREAYAVMARFFVDHLR